MPTPPDHPGTGEPVTRCRERIEYLIEVLEKEKQTILIPTPALAELLVKEETFGPSHLEFIDRTAAFQIADFDRRAAIEVASMTRSAMSHKSQTSDLLDTKTKVKFDWQILAIAKVHAATTIYTDDARLRKRAKRLGVAAIGVHDLPLKPDPPQGELPLTRDEE